MASFGARDVARLLKDDGIVRNRSKIEAVINNAQRAQALVQQHGSLSAYLWSFEPDPSELPPPQSVSTSASSQSLSKALKELGWKFLGPTTVYAFMQAMGLINDHVDECMVRSKVEGARQRFKRPRP